MPLGMDPHLARPPLLICPSACSPSSVCGRSFGDIFIGTVVICRRRFWPGLLPKPLGDRERVDLEILPPGHLIAGLMQLPMMTAAERDGEFVADFEAEGSRLSKAQMMRIGWLPAADQARL